MATCRASMERTPIDHHISEASTWPLNKVRSPYVVAAASNTGHKRKSKLLSCSRVEFLGKKDDGKKTQALRNKYTIRARHEKQKEKSAVGFVTKVQIRTSKTPSPQTEGPCNDERVIHTSSNSNEDCVADSVYDNSAGEKIPFTPEKTRVSQVTGESDMSLRKNAIELLWLDNSLKLVEDARVEETRIVRSLSRRLKQDRSQFYRTASERPTASFASPTKGEINLLLQNPDFKKNSKQDRCHGHKVLIMSRSRTMSIPVSTYYPVGLNRSRTGTGSHGIVLVKNFNGVQMCANFKEKFH